MSNRIVHDQTWQAARAVLTIFAPCLREEEQVEAFREVVAVLKSHIEGLVIMLDRQRERLSGRNGERHHERRGEDRGVRD